MLSVNLMMIPDRINLLWVVVILFLSITTTSCSDRSIIPTTDDGVVSFDSVYLSIVDTVVINIPQELNPVPSVSQIEELCGQDYYIALDNQAIYVFDIYGDSLKRVVSLDHVSKLSNLSGLYYYNDTYVIYDYKHGVIGLLDSNANVKVMFPIGNEKVIDPWGIAGTSVLLSSDHVFLSGPPINIKNDKEATSMSIDINSGKILTGGFRPKIYGKYNLGHDYMWRVYHTVDGHGNLIVSLPASSEVYVFDEKMRLIKSFYMKSRYATSLFEASPNMTSYEEKKYYLGLSTYGPIEFDGDRNLLYRIATHPMGDFRMGGMTLKPFSVITSDLNGNLISETPILNNDNSMFYDLISATSKGLYMQVLSQNENQMKFVLFKHENE